MSGIMSMLLGAVSSAAAAVDEFFNRVTLLLPGNGTNGAQNNTFLDSSTNNFTITRNGNTTQGTFSPFSQTGWSAYLTGVYGSSTFTSRTLFNGNSTIEGWVYANALSGQQTIIVGGGINFGTNGAKLRIDDGVNAGSIFESTGTITANTWNYVAVVRSSNTFSFYINGNLDSSNASISSFYTSNATSLNVGAFNSGGTSVFTGYLSNIRVSNVARTISLPTSAYSSDANTVWLIFQSNRFVDNSGNAYALTFVGTPSVQAFSPFAPTAAYSAATVGGSGYFDGSGDNLVSASLGTSIGTGDYCLEAWVYTTNAATSFVSSIVLNNSSGYIIYVQISANTIRFLDFQNPGTNFIISGGTINSNEWVHIVATRQSGNMRAFVNGRLAAYQASINFNYGTAGTVEVPPSVAQYVSQVRVNIGSVPTGYQTSSTTTGTQIFTSPTAPTTTTSQGATAGNVRLLLNMTNAGITDATAKNDLETVGNAQISTTQSKFGGSSMYFDGSGDYLVTPSSPVNTLGSGDFTVEFWAYPSNTSSAYRALVSSENYNGATGGWSIYQNGTSIEVWLTSGQVINATSALTATTWQHVALSRASGTVRLFVNGTSAGSASSSAEWTGQRIFIGDNNVSGTDYFFNGYLDDIRITRGFARYTANFTAPTSAFALQ